MLNILNTKLTHLIGKAVILICTLIIWGCNAQHNSLIGRWSLSNTNMTSRYLEFDIQKDETLVTFNNEIWKPINFEIKNDSIILGSMRGIVQYHLPDSFTIISDDSFFSFNRIKPYDQKDSDLFRLRELRYQIATSDERDQEEMNFLKERAWEFVRDEKDSLFIENKISITKKY